MKWMVMHGSLFLGPYNEDEVCAKLENRTLELDTLVRREHEETWTVVTEISAFSAAIQARRHKPVSSTTSQAAAVAHNSDSPASVAAPDQREQSAKNNAGFEYQHIYYAIGILVALFLGYRGIVYSNCRDRCQGSGYFGSSDLGRVASEWANRSCLNSCSFFGDR